MQKDILFYEDLIYYLKNLAGLEFEKDEITDKRIEERINPKNDKIYNIAFNEPSEFLVEVFKILIDVFGKIVDIHDKNIQEVINYKDLVQKQICLLEEKLKRLMKMKNLKR